ncbi:MAG: MFS transporter [Candidatus Pacearchaeota archaeon]
MKNKKDSPEVKKLKEKARNYSISEGIFWSAESSLGHHYVSPFAVAINSSSALVAMVSAVTGLIDPLSEVFGSRLIEKYSRKKILLKSVFFEALMWIPFVLIAIAYLKGILILALPYILLFSFGLYSVFKGIGHPAWFSWMGDIVNEKNRGKWFSKRNLLIGVMSVVLVVSSSFFLDYLKRHGMTMIGFSILFFIAFISRISSIKFIKKTYEPKIKLKKGDYFSFTQFLLNAKNNNFGRFAFFRFFFTFANTISSSLLVVYLLRTLGFSYAEYMIIIFAGTGISLFTIELLGKFSDGYGNYLVLCISSWVIAVLPILWILNHSFIYLILVPSLISGIGWAGIHLTERNFIYENVKAEKRGLAVSYYNLLWGLGIFFGSGLGALLIKFLNTSFIESIIFIFILGGVLRIFSILFWLPKIKEVRKTRSFRSSRAFKEIILKQAIPTIHGEVRDVMHIKKYFFMK